MAQLADNHALLLYRVGPVLCCAPTLCVATLISPPSLAHPPDSSDSHPGIFRHDGNLVSLMDLRHLFGVEKSDRTQPGRIIICHLADQHRGFLVDEVIDVIATPGRGWGQLPPSLSNGVFRRSLLLDEKIYLYCEFEKLQMIRSNGFLKPWIQQLHEKPRPREDTSAHTAGRAPIVKLKPVLAKTTIESSAIPPPPTTSSPAVSDRRPPPSARPVRQHRPHHTYHKADKTQPAGKQAPTNNTRQTENRKRQSAAPVKPSHSAAPPAHASSLNHAPKISFPRQPPHPADYDVRTSANNAGTGLQIMGVLLICIGLISATAYLWPNHTVTPVAIKSATSSPGPEALAAANPRPLRPENGASPITEAAREKEPDKASATAEQEDQGNSGNRYQASIEHRQHVVTIILTAPANDTVIRGDNDSPAHRQASEIHPAIKHTPAFVSSHLSPRQHIEEVVHIVVRGDTLWHIARRYIHNPFRYPELARLNKIRNPDLIYPGDRVRIIRLYPQELAPAPAD